MRVLWTLWATQQGELAGIDATGKPIVVKGAAVARVVDGWIVRIISMFDNGSFVQQLDAPAELAAANWKQTAREADDSD